MTIIPPDYHERVPRTFSTTEDLWGVEWLWPNNVVAMTDERGLETGLTSSYSHAPYWWDYRKETRIMSYLLICVTVRMTMGIVTFI